MKGRTRVRSPLISLSTVTMEELLLTGNYCLKSMKPPDLSDTNKKELRAYFENSYEINESLFTGLKDESVFNKCPDRLRLPLIFYYAHTATVYVNKLLLAELIKERVNFEFETLFETGVDEMSWDDTENYRMGGSFKWPSVKEVTDYRQKVRNLILKVIEDTPLELPINQDSPWWALLMGIEHERIHIETSSVLIRQLPLELVQLPRDWKYGPMSSGNGLGKNTLIRVDKCDVTVGKPFDFPSYGWDNEYPELKVSVPPFEATKYLITNREFYEFVKAGGYTNQEYWTEEAWKWKEFRQANHPTFWVCTKGCKGGCGGVLGGYSPCRPEVFHSGDNSTNQRSVNGSNGVNNGTENAEFRYRAIFSVIDMPWDWPADVNYHEARAYCAWKGPEFRLPTEAEHHAMRDTEKDSSLGIAADIIYEDEVEANLNLVYGSSTPVNMYKPTEKGFHDVHGNVWEWVEDSFNGLPGSETHYLYDDFSSPCFDGKHTMMQGGSWVSTGDEASRFARFSFRRHFFQHLGFRMVRSVNTDEPLPLRLVSTPVFVLGLGLTKHQLNIKSAEIEKVFVPSTNIQYHYDTEQHLHEITGMQFTVTDHNYVTQLKEICLNSMAKYNTGRKTAIHFGCGPGQLAFDLTAAFDEVIAVDYSGCFINAAMTLQARGSLMYDNQLLLQNGTKKAKPETSVEVKLDDKINREKVTFKQLTWIPNELFGYDLTVIDMTDRVSNAKAWLVRLWEIAESTGVIAVVSSTDWNKDKLEPIVGRR
ncbi:uncharacterized protein [Ptychodera flava]|uniref:uncharacterized protein isoform X1 n=2 Tax=Ptychodera flava TaxID=63121 RepID=UPI00396A2399